jgi:hypothetical protein
MRSSHGIADTNRLNTLVSIVRAHLALNRLQKLRRSAISIAADAPASSTSSVGAAFDRRFTERRKLRLRAARSSAPLAVPVYRTLRP